MGINIKTIFDLATDKNDDKTKLKSKDKKIKNKK